MDALADFWRYEFLQRALFAAILIGAIAPGVGIHLVQRRLSLIGDGLGHVALAGVAVGIVTGAAPVATALAAAVMGAVAIELVRASGRTTGDVALGIMFYGGIATGVVVLSQASPATPVNLDAYLFGSITTTTTADLWTIGALGIAVGLVTIGLRRPLFAVSYDPEFATASGLPVLRLNLVLAVLTAVTVVVAMRVVGLLLVSALMIVPVAAAQVLARSFRATAAASVTVGLAAAVGGVVVSYAADTPSGGTIVLGAVAAFGASHLAARSRRAPQRAGATGEG